jgi:hypothetical protein
VCYCMDWLLKDKVLTCNRQQKERVGTFLWSATYMAAQIFETKGGA